MLSVRIGIPTNPYKNLNDSIEEIVKSGADYIELTLEKLQPTKKLEKTLRYYKKRISFLAVHLDDFKEDDSYLRRIEDFFKMFTNLSIKPVLIIHFNSRYVEEYDERIKVIKKVKELCADYGFNLTLENTSETPEFFKQLLSETGCDLTLDVGHANLLKEDEPIQHFIKTFPTRIKHLHFHDNHGGEGAENDLHLSINEGEINFKKILNQFEEINYSGNITLEVREDFRENIKKLRFMKNSFSSKE